MRTELENVGMNRIQTEHAELRDANIYILSEDSKNSN